MAPPDRIIATILGCGSSGGVPRLGNDWGACDPSDPRNRRRRCALLIEGWRDAIDEPTRALIDTGPDLREQLLGTRVDRIDAVLYTHEHADHTHGIDDLRVLALHNRRRVDVYFSAACGLRLREAFGYCFSTPQGSSYPPILNAHEITDGDMVRVEGPGGTLEFQAFNLHHGDIDALGYRVGGLAYTPDLSSVPETAGPALEGLDTWIVDALRPTPHPSHLSLPETLQLIAKHAPRQAVLTNMHIDLDYAETDRTTPSNVAPAFDGMEVKVTADRR
ncbi:phosphoribosyl 1,2-cyclic phosphate phosphodiesterase [Devosia lucknowensis]|uniref:Phosphoribosyl 1,2-cyclic phosphate phosphodiesterase n=1 Tax=Devosia lucknowensis TaxID=1096929 RepID=A0A1Y6EPP2_9HYPH|nr:MBL fold metallo-hydrolase [Devosia lucknowensis]SMQ64665.1 phosphoribosyl 1,2-cyclic phosphate phosphodiesterase [Devosia lucknowensis]